ncbi:hypothetical protein D9619_006138 [Psilocybe cf. subviscida]|uniref:Uncharacterized protein n=1 Tax=Psilocybe cf. subviscida TaxID=2480587 RepID=A0A8H5B5W6_9AGAR|nr:hypothetical protein D9619_006138 [Psilocybe cf. subviscida]
MSDGTVSVCSVIAGVLTFRLLLSTLSPTNCYSAPPVMSTQSAADYGIPPRPPTATTALWTHLLRPGAQNSVSQPDISALAPPAKPLDKTATSMRILLHDSQAHFEKFTVHVGKLLDGVKESRHEIKSVQSLFERDRESLVGDMTDLVNRAQTEIQKAVGSPAQTTAVEESFKDVNHRLSGLEQRLDAMQAFNQSHTQQLQTQMQATQILLDKQGTILSTLAPLVPLLQAIPAHMDALKTHIQASTHKPTLNVDLVAGSRHRPPSPISDTISGSKRKRSDTQCTTPAGAVLGAPLKRLRTKTSSPSPPRLAADYQQHLRSQVSPVASRTERPSNADAYTDPLPLSVSACPISPTPHASRQRNLTPGQQPQQRAHVTPRRPLMDLLLPLPVRQDTTPRNKTTPRCQPQDTTEVQERVTVVRVNPSARASASAPNSVMGAQMQLRAQMPPAGSVNNTTSASSGAVVNAPPIPPQGARPPRILRMQTSFENGTKNIAGEGPVQTGPGSSAAATTAATTEAGSATEKSSAVPLAGPAPVARPAATLRLSAQSQKRDDKSNDDPISKLPAPNLGQQSTVASSSSSSSSKMQPPPAAAVTKPNPTFAQARSRSTSASHGRVLNPHQVKQTPLEPVSVFDRTRQAPVREPGRRFIALVDSEDEDDDEFE